MNKKQSVTLLICLAVFTTFILGTSPYHLPLILVLIPGVAFIIAVYILLTYSVKRLGLKPKARRVAVNVLTAIISVFSVLLSVGQLTFRDFSLLLALALIGMFYMARMLDQ